jgi:hypothetical protein
MIYYRVISAVYGFYVIKLKVGRSVQYIQYIAVPLKRCF